VGGNSARCLGRDKKGGRIRVKGIPSPTRMRDQKVRTSSPRLILGDKENTNGHGEEKILPEI